MIHSSQGGTAAELWTSLSGLQKEPSLSGYVDTLNQVKAKYQSTESEKYSQQMAEYGAKLKEWNETVGKDFGKAIQDWNQSGQKTPRPQPTTPKPKPPQDPVGKNPTCLFNGMIAPLIPYAIRGTIWYQGESNNLKPFEYRTLFPTLIADWREKWGEGDFPFLFVQIAPYKADCAELREAQFLTWKKTKNTAMAVTIDVGDANKLHPSLKEPIGDRLALAARALVYGDKVEYSGPEYDSFKIDGNKIILSFTHIGKGLVAKDGPLKGFKIAGSDKKFVDGKAEIEGDKIVVSSDQVTNPIAVRYGFENVPDGNLWNEDGLPASTFRTDPESLTADVPKKPGKEMPAADASQETPAQ
jgi:sialate O-acetylesterase